jgi:hypothetical protein
MPSQKKKGGGEVRGRGKHLREVKLVTPGGDRMGRGLLLTVSL